MVGRKALSLLSVAAVALAVASSAFAQIRAADSDLAGLVFPTQSRDWGSDPGGFKAASLDLAAALTGKACGAQEFHVWTIADFAAGVTISEAVDESFRTAGWTLDLVSRDSELSRIYLASRADEGLILNWMPEEGVVGLLMCVAAEQGSVPERVAEAAPRGFSLDPTLPPLPLPRPAPLGEASAVAAPDDPAAVEPALAAAALPDPAAVEPALPAAVEPALPADAELALAVNPGAETLSTVVPSAEAPAPVVAATAVAPVNPPPAAELMAFEASPIPAAVADRAAIPAAVPPLGPAAAPAAASPTTVAAAAAPAPMVPAVPAPVTGALVVPPISTPPPAVVAAPPPTTAPAPGLAFAASPTRTPIDLGITAAIVTDAGPAPALTGEVAVAETAPAAAPAPVIGPGARPTPSPAAAMYERVPPPPALLNPISVADHRAAPISTPPPAAGPVVADRPVTLLAQGGAPAGGAVSPQAIPTRVIQAEPVRVTTVVAPALAPGGAIWPYFLLAVILAGAGLVILLRRWAPPAGETNPLWPTTLASVVGADLDERVGHDGIQFTPVLRYRFSIGENEFEAITEGWGGRPLPTRSAAEAVLASFPEHARVEISYDPTDPTRIALPEAARPADPMIMVAVTCLVLAAVTLVLTLF